MQQTLDFIRHVKANGVRRGNRTGVGTIQIPSFDLSFDTRKETPMLTSRKQKWENPFHEMNWFISGSQNIKYLQDNNCPFWNEWATTEDVVKPVPMTIYERMEAYGNQPNPEKLKSEILEMHHQVGTQNLHLWFDGEGIPATTNKVIIPKGSVGPMYGYLMRHYPTSKGGSIDQLAYILHNLSHNQLSRRHLIDLWCPEFLPDERYSPQENVKAGLGALAPCHFAIEFIVEEMNKQDRIDWGLENLEGFGDLMAQTDAGYMSVDSVLTEQNVPKHWLDIKFHMRSNDVVLGFPANVLGYSILLMMVGQQVNMAHRYCFYTGSNVHIYENHFEALEEWLERPINFKRPKLKLVNKPKDIESYTVDDFVLEDYHPEPHIKFPVAV